MPYDPRDRFRKLPKPVRPEEMIEMVDVSELPVRDEGEARERLLRQGGSAS